MREGRRVREMTAREKNPRVFRTSSSEPESLQNARLRTESLQNVQLSVTDALRPG